jgi:hypothetical protein
MRRVVIKTCGVTHARPPQARRLALSAWIIFTFDIKIVQMKEACPIF